jgi:thioredoxin reductase (NADPH)
LPEPIVIIGAGPAGITAAVQLKRLGFNPLLIDSRGTKGCGLVRNGFRVENYPGLVAPVSGTVLMERFLDHLSRFELNVCEDKIVKIKQEKSDSYVLVGKTDNYQAEIVIIACGTSPRKLPLELTAEVSPRVHYDLVDFMPRLQGAFANSASGSGFSVFGQPGQVNADLNKEVVIAVGGGEAAQDYSLSLSQAGFQVKLLVRGNRLKGNMHLRNNVVSNRSIDLYFERNIEKVVRRGNSLEIQTRRKNQLEIWQSDNMVVAIGRQVEQLFELPRELFAKRQIQTSLPGLFQIGDFRLGSLGQVGMAVGDGLRVASLLVHY